MFDIGSSYSRKDIHAQVGGGLRASLLTSRGNVVGICFIPERNPQAPRVILVGPGKQSEKAAQMLVAQASAVPVFAKRKASAYEHLGVFKGESYADGELILKPETAAATA